MDKIPTSKQQDSLQRKMRTSKPQVSLQDNVALAFSKRRLLQPRAGRAQVRGPILFQALLLSLMPFLDEGHRLISCNEVVDLCHLFYLI